MAERKLDVGGTAPQKGNFVSEWFGHRVYPIVDDTPQSFSDQAEERCPFLSSAVGEKRKCVKPASSSGVCTINSGSNGPRQDWLVCPYRALDDWLLQEVAQRLFSVGSNVPLRIVPAPMLSKPKARKDLTQMVLSGGRAFVYFQDKLGGEISLQATDRSPEVAFDVTMVELEYRREDRPSVGRYGIFEVQTMDFHGTYRFAVNNLKDALRLHRKRFAATLQRNPSWLSERIEGPNIANVFKRTFYQMMIKFQIGAHGSCAGTALAIPRSVWDSWQRHLGKPELTPKPDGTFELIEPRASPAEDAPPGWIYIFDIDSSTSSTPAPIVICSVIATDPESLAHYALNVAPQAAIAAGGVADRVLFTIRNRLRAWWPELAGAEA